MFKEDKIRVGKEGHSRLKPYKYKWHGKYEKPQADCFRPAFGGAVLGNEAGEVDRDKNVRLVYL